MNIKSETGPVTGPYEVKGFPQKGVIELLSPAGQYCVIDTLKIKVWLSGTEEPI